MTGVFRGRLWGCGGLIELSDIGWSYIFQKSPYGLSHASDCYQHFFRIAHFYIYIVPEW